MTYGAPHHLVADSPVRDVRRTRSGDAWEARTRTPARSGTSSVALGLPTLGVPAAASGRRPLPLRSHSVRHLGGVSPHE